MNRTIDATTAEHRLVCCIDNTIDFKRGDVTAMQRNFVAECEIDWKAAKFVGGSDDIRFLLVAVERGDPWWQRRTGRATNTLGNLELLCSRPPRGNLFQNDKVVTAAVASTSALQTLCWVCDGVDGNVLLLLELALLGAARFHLAVVGSVIEVVGLAPEAATVGSARCEHADVFRKKEMFYFA